MARTTQTQTPISTEPVAELETLVEQTEFAGNEPLFEKVALPVAPKLKQEVTVPPKKKPLPLLIAGGAIGVVLVVGLLVLLLPRSARIMPQTTATPTPSPTIQMTDQQRRVKELGDDLQAADPNKLDLPFPPISLDINLGDPKKQ